MLKRKSTTVMLLVLTCIIITFAGCMQASGTKASGGGWIDSASMVAGEKATFGFTARIASDETIEENVYIAKGEFQLTDSGTGQVFHAKVYGTYVYGEADDTCIFAGSTRNGLTVAVMAFDKDHDGVVQEGDEISIEIQDDEYNTVYSNGGLLQGGNISVR